MWTDFWFSRLCICFGRSKTLPYVWFFYKNGRNLYLARYSFTKLSQNMYLIDTLIFQYIYISICQMWLQVMKCLFILLHFTFLTSTPQHKMWGRYIIFVEKSMSVCVSDNSKTTDRICMKFGLKLYQRCRIIEFEYGTNPKSKVAKNLHGWPLVAVIFKKIPKNHFK